MKKTPFVRNPYNYDVDSASDDSGLKCEDKSRTIQSQSAETDINNIVKMFGLTGELPPPRTPPQYGDFTGITTYHEAMNAVAQAHEAFDALPAKIRNRFDNDPEKLINFVSDNDNYDEAQRMGLVPPKEQLEQLEPQPAPEAPKGPKGPKADKEAKKEPPVS